jgi:hypothetical protein
VKKKKTRDLVLQDSQRKFALRSIATTARHGSAYTMLTQKIVKSMRERWIGKTNFHATKKGRMRPNPAKNSFTQLSKKLEKLEKKIKKQGAKLKKPCRDISYFDSE